MGQMISNKLESKFARSYGTFCFVFFPPFFFEAVELMDQILIEHIMVWSDGKIQRVYVRYNGIRRQRLHKFRGAALTVGRWRNEDGCEKNTHNLLKRKKREVCNKVNM